MSQPGGPGGVAEEGLSLEPPGALAAPSGPVEDLKSGRPLWGRPQGTQRDLLPTPHANPAGTEV